MASSAALRNHPRDDDTDYRTAPPTPTFKSLHEKRSMGAGRAMRSLTITLALNLSVTVAVMFVFGSGKQYNALAKPFWFPPLWLIHAASLASSFLMGLAGWMMWAEGGFHSETDALPLYLAQVSLGVVWDPLVLVIGSGWLGLGFCLVQLVTLVGVSRRFGRVNPFAGDIVRLCMVWVAFLTIITFKIAIL
ncbi:hypothetical protein MLD38_036073 [Melastoma candidum]|uniref:Uncharacterized protein n=1 Tax=Melastoma candidum TaxID=119954 RepID=A0ACB9LI28_9MYRT|nr:hypothetical protein MLD38_036073 [Melastoma candidum]